MEPWLLQRLPQRRWRATFSTLHHTYTLHNGCAYAHPLMHACRHRHRHRHRHQPHIWMHIRPSWGPGWARTRTTRTRARARARTHARIFDAHEVGLGGNISHSLMSCVPGKVPTPRYDAEGHDAGNGSLMRLAPVRHYIRVLPYACMHAFIHARMRACILVFAYTQVLLWVGYG